MGEAPLGQLGRYRLVAELGRGAMGVVYRAEDPLLDRAVAIKTILMAGDAAERAEYEARFHQEARAAGGLNHPNVITIYDIGREGEVVYMAMELLEGTDLRELMRRGGVPLAAALDIAAQVADGLAFAHERGVVHRDIKPANIMVVRGQHAKIMDFGIARMRASDMTQTGAIIGSPKYMSPEQVAGRRADHRSDIFSLGVVLYELAAGAPPFPGPEVSLIMHQIATATPRPPSAVNASVPPMLDLIVAKALQKNPDARYQSAAELAADLRACLAGLPVAEGAAQNAAEATVKLETAAATACAGATQGASPTRIAAAADARSAGSETYLYLARRFDSDAAMRRLSELSASGARPPGPSSASGGRAALPRLWRSPEWRILAAAAGAALVAALAIALL
ncbi:MAG TPA: serine/threonine-protein kinase [Burkholderiales bacterium]|nr:serine/threonine-protein kinase [Burkholderiales bacterium]